MAALLSAAPLVADIISQTSSAGRQVVIQRDAIVVKQDPATITYKHFDLKERRIVKATLQESSLPYTINRSAPDNRRQIVDLWRRFGFSATVTDTSGKASQVCDVYIDFYPPGGQGSLLETLPADTHFSVQFADGSTDLVDFADIARVEFVGDHLRLTLTNGQVKEARYLMPTAHPAEARILGVTDKYDPASEDTFDFSLSFARIKQIDFDR
ncbi:MAG TPA: hypothetical protein VG860_18755 [Terriglobia bacterium]|jgi:hypothetical protein|nr:hypothetical protein [Terriglobia bacterium]